MTCSALSPDDRPAPARADALARRVADSARPTRAPQARIRRQRDDENITDEVLFASPTICWLAMAILMACPLFGAPAWARVSTPIATGWSTRRSSAPASRDPRVIQAMRDTPRHEFVPLNVRPQRLLRHGAADRRGPDHLAAVHRGLHDRATRARSRPTRCWRSAPAAATRRPCLVHWSTKSTRSRSSSRWANGRRDAQAAEVRQRARQDRRRLSGLARARAVRQDHRHLLARESAAQAGRATARRRTDGGAGRRALPANAVSVHEAGRQARQERPVASIVRADDRQSRGQPRVRPIPSTAQQRRLRRAASETTSASPPEGDREAVRQPNAEASGAQARRLVLPAAIEMGRSQGRAGGHALRDVLEHEPGRGAQALQGMAVDGRKVKQLDVSLWVKGTDLCRGATPKQQPVLAITFYDENRATGRLHLARAVARHVRLAARDRDKCACRPGPAKPSCASAWAARPARSRSTISRLRRTRQWLLVVRS